MIFKLDLSIKTAPDNDKNQLGRFIIAVMEHRHFLDISSDMWEWINDNVLCSTFMGKYDIEAVLSNTSFRDPQGLLLTRLSSVSVGYTDECAPPSLALVLASSPSYVVLENETNDWAVISKWIELLKNVKDFRAVNTYVENKRQKRELLPGTGGGGGQIRNTLSSRSEPFGKFANLKVSTVYDSDKTSKDAPLSNEKTDIADFCESKGIQYHILYKREMENYFHTDCYIKAGFADSELSHPSKEDWDFMDVEVHIGKNKGAKKYAKKNLPDLCPYATRKMLIEITAHHPVLDKTYQVNEIQKLILMLASIL